MFREVARKKQAMTQDECIELLKETKRGMLAVLGDDDYPYVIPINHYYCEDDGRIYFHGGKRGHRVDAVERHDKVSFCVIDEGQHVEGDDDWVLRFRSVVVFGRMEVLDDYDRMVEMSSELTRKFTDDPDFLAWELERSAKATLMHVLIPEHITGKRIKEQ